MGGGNRKQPTDPDLKRFKEEKLEKFIKELLQKSGQLISDDIDDLVLRLDEFIQLVRTRVIELDKVPTTIHTMGNIKFLTDILYHLPGIRNSFKNLEWMNDRTYFRYAGLRLLLVNLNDVNNEFNKNENDRNNIPWLKE